MSHETTVSKSETCSVNDESLVARHGALVSGKTLRQLLGFKSESAFRSAVLSGRVPVAVFSLAGRRGFFAKTQEVEDWLRSLPVASRS